MRGTNTARRMLLGESTTKVALCFLALLGIHLALVIHYWFLGDDCYITFRYAKNWVDGIGPVYNPGEAVEGYTNFSWVVLSGLVLRLEGNPELWMNGLGTLSGALALWLVWRAAQRVLDGYWTLLPVALLCCHRSWAAWSTGGLETRFFTLLVLAAVLRVPFEARQPRSFPWLGLICGLAALTRPEGYGLTVGCAALLLLLRGGRPSRWDAARLGLAALLIGPHVAWRLSFYGLPLPNTFYAKVDGLWIEQGVLYVWLLLRDYSVWMVLPALPLIGDRFRAGRGRHELLCWLATLFGYLGYLVAVGGDYFEFRLWDPALPFLYLLVGTALAEASRLLVSTGRSVVGVGLLLGCAIGLTAAPVALRFQPVRGISGLEWISQFGAQRRADGLALAQLLGPDDTIAVFSAGAVPYFTGARTLDLRGLNDLEVARTEVPDAPAVPGHLRVAPWSLIQEREIFLVDGLNRPLWSAQGPGSDMEETGSWRGLLGRSELPAPLLDRALSAQGYHRVRLGDQTLVFRSTWSREAISERLEGCGDCALLPPTPSPPYRPDRHHR